MSEEPTTRITPTTTPELPNLSEEGLTLVYDALLASYTALATEDERNAALNLAETVHYRPLTLKVEQAYKALLRVLGARTEACALIEAGKLKDTTPQNAPATTEKPAAEKSAKK